MSNAIPRFNRQNVLRVAVALVTGLLLVTAIAPHDRTTWWMEVAPVLVGLPLLWLTRRRYPLTNLLYALLFLHAVILIVGGYYTYARVPLGYWMADLLGSDRNPYDKIGHFMQGFVPALIAREIFARGNYVRRGRMFVFLILCVVMAISATYELIEWAAALGLGQGADEFLGTQGYQWDTQSDMFMALIGGTTALLTLSRQHDRQLRTLTTLRGR